MEQGSKDAADSFAGFLFAKKTLQKGLTSKLGGDKMGLQRKLVMKFGGRFMNKEEILERSRNENTGGDEREKQIKDRSMMWTYLAMVTAAAVFSFVRGAQDQPVMDLCATVALSVCVGQFYRFIKGRKKSALFIALVMLAVSIAASVRFFMGH